MSEHFRVPKGTIDMHFKDADVELVMLDDGGLEDARGELQALIAFAERMPWVFEDQKIILERARKALSALERV